MSTSVKHTVVGLRNKIEHGIYTHVLKPIFFKQDPEMVHNKMVHFGSTLGSFGLGRHLLSAAFSFHDERLQQDILGIHFNNPIGLAAGFDKNAELGQVLPEIGFGFAELGSITAKVCEGNPQPRLWRLPESKGLVVYYGLKNDGVDVISKRISELKTTMPIGTSVAMTNCAENLDTRKAILDYAESFKKLAHIGQYFTINISCPNAQGGQPFVSPFKLDYLLDIIDEIKTPKPVFIKLSPDMGMDVVDEILAVARKHRVHGIICTNLTKNRNTIKIKEKNLPQVGGISGKPVQDLSDNLIKHIYTKEGNRFVIVGCGGVFSAEDAYRKITLGASLVQLVTGMIFEGPQLISEINRGLVTFLEKDGFTTIKEAIGSKV